MRNVPISMSAEPGGDLQLPGRDHLWSCRGSSGCRGGGGSLWLEETAGQGGDRHHEQTDRGGGGQGHLAPGK